MSTEENGQNGRNPMVLRHYAGNVGHRKKGC